MAKEAKKGFRSKWKAFWKARCQDYHKSHLRRFQMPADHYIDRGYYGQYGGVRSGGLCRHQF